MTSESIRHKIENEPDFIDSKKFDYSLRKILAKYPNGVPDRLIAQALHLSEAEINQHFQQILDKLKENLTNETVYLFPRSR